MPHTDTKPVAATNRRDIMKGVGLGLAMGTLATASLAGSVPATAQSASGTGSPSGSRILRSLPRSDNTVPAIGLGTFLTFDRLPGARRDSLREVVRIYWEGGARLIDTSPLYGTAEYSVGAFAADLGITDEMILSNKIWSTGEFAADESHAVRSLQQSQGRLWRERIDIMHCHSLTNVDGVLNVLRAWKKEGLIRYVGVSHHESVYQPALASWIARDMVDFVQVNYSIFNRSAEEHVLPVAAGHGVGVLVNMPLEKARLHKVVEGRPLPDFAREFGAETWSQFFLKWVISNPVVTCALPSTSNPDHARENIAALSGPLPDAEMRNRMFKHMETIPGFQEIGKMAWYPGKTYDGVIRRAQADLKVRS